MRQNMEGFKDANHSSMSYFYDGTPVPELLTEEEAIRFLRLDTEQLKDPSNTLRYYREKGLLRPTRVGKTNKYLKKELLYFLDLLTSGNIS